MTKMSFLLKLVLDDSLTRKTGKWSENQPSRFLLWSSNQQRNLCSYGLWKLPYFRHSSGSSTNWYKTVEKKYIYINVEIRNSNIY